MPIGSPPGENILLVGAFYSVVCLSIHDFLLTTSCSKGPGPTYEKGVDHENQRKNGHEASGDRIVVAHRFQPRSG